MSKLGVEKLTAAIDDAMQQVGAAYQTALANCESSKENHQLSELALNCGVRFIVLGLLNSNDRDFHLGQILSQLPSVIQRQLAQIDHAVTAILGDDKGARQ